MLVLTESNRVSMDLTGLANYMMQRNICMYIKFVRMNGKSKWFITVRRLKDSGRSYSNLGVWTGPTLAEAFDKVHDSLGKQLEFFWRK